MRAQTTLFLQPSNDEESVCAICGDETIEVIMCCRKPICSTCLEKWAEEANSCPFCARQIHNGEDRRRLNDNIGLGDHASVSSHVLFRLIRARLLQRADTINQVLGRINEFLGQPEQEYPTHQPIRMPISTPDPTEPFYVYTFNFPDDSGVTIHEGDPLQQQQQSNAPPPQQQSNRRQKKAGEFKFVFELVFNIPPRLPLFVCASLMGLFFYLMNKVLIS